MIKLKIKNLLNIKIFFLFLAFSFLLSGVAVAHTGQNSFWTPGEPIVPCGAGSTDPNTGLRFCDPNIPQEICRECTQCDLLHLVRHLIDFILVAATPILGTLFFIIAGVYIMLGGSNPGMLATGKRMFQATFIGILIVMLAWLVTNTLIRSLVDPSALQGTNWYEFQCPFQ